MKQKKLWTLISLLTVSALLLATCATGPVKFPTGEYIDYKGFHYDFDEDGTYGVSESDGKPALILGEYTIDGNVITIIDNLVYCPYSEGSYYWSVGKDRALNFEVIAEECGNRMNQFVNGLSFLR